MHRRYWFSWLLASIPLSGGLFLMVLVLLPYGTMKIFLDVLSKDGTLSMLNPENAFVFRGLIGAAGLVILGIACLTGMRRLDLVTGFFKQLWEDCRSFFTVPGVSKADKGFLAALLVIMALAVIVRLPFMEGPMLHDESYTVVSFADTIWHAVTDYSLPNNHVLNTILVHYSIRLFGLAPWAVRLPAFLAGILIVPGVYFLAKRLYDSWTGLMAGVLVAFSPVLISYSTSGRGYMLVALFTLVILILGDLVCRKKNLFAWGLISVFSALGMFTVPVMLFPFAALFTWLFLENLLSSSISYSSKWEFFRHWLLAGLAAAVLTILLYTPILIFTGPHELFANSFVAPLPWGDLLTEWRARLVNTLAGWTNNVPLVITLLLGAGCVLSLVFHRKLSTSRVPLQLAAFLGIAAVLIVQRPNAWSKVWVFLQPLVLIWGAAGTVGLLRGIRLKFLRGIPLSGVVTGIALLIGIVAAVRMVPTLPEQWAKKGSVEKAVLYLEEGQLQENDFIIVVSPDDASLWYYFLLYGISNQHFDKRIPFERALVVVDPDYEQTFESVVAARGPDDNSLDLQAAHLLKKFGVIQVFECPRK